MIKDKRQLLQYKVRDALACNRESIKPRLFGDEIWKFQLALRNYEFAINTYSNKNPFLLLKKMFYRVRYHNLSIKLSFSIPPNCFGKGLAIVHQGSIVVSPYASIGENCRIHECVTIGATNGECNAPQLGNNVFIGSGQNSLETSPLRMMYV